MNVHERAFQIWLRSSNCTPQEAYAAADMFEAEEKRQRAARAQASNAGAFTQSCTCRQPFCFCAVSE